jgi:4'-phosphopantetheinyl transferase
MKLYYALHPNLKPKFFYESWTRKEAYLKAIGAGLFIPPNQIELFYKSENPNIFWNDRSLDSFRKKDWSFRNLNHLKDYVAAVVVEGKDFEIYNFYWGNNIFQHL